MPKTAFITTKYPTTTTTPNGSGAHGTWSNPANIFNDDGSSASTAYLLDAVTMGKVPLADLVGQGFGFAIPSNAIIDGIKVEVEVASSNRWVESGSVVKLMKAGAAVGTNKAGSGSSSSGVWTYGGATDLWGTTWTPAQINAANFGVFGNFDSVSSSPADFQLSIDFYRVTVYWHYSVDVSPADVPKRYLYKIFNKGVFLGNLPNVVSKFGYAYDINSIGSSINIEVGVSADTSRLPGDRIVTEAGEPITTEAGDYIYTEGQSPILGYGNSVDPFLVQNGNRVEVWEYSYYYPNGKLMFKGQVNRIEAGFGDAKDNTIKMVVLSDGLDLAHYIARGSPFNYTTDVSQTAQNASVTVADHSGGGGGGWDRYGQTWKVGAGVSKLGAITLMLSGTADVTVTVYDGVNGSALGSVTQAVALGSPTANAFYFANLIPVVAGGTYFFVVSVGPGQSINLHFNNVGGYADGIMYNSSYSGGSGGGGYFPITGWDLYFTTASGLPTTLATYTSKDPSTGMLKPIIDDYVARGGMLNYSGSSIEATGLSLTAQFNTETIYDAMKRVLSLAPNGFYFYVDLGTDVIHFKQTLSTATYKLIKGRHLNKINLALSIENVKNDLLFSGAETAGTNLYTEYTDQTSKTNYGQRLERKSDNRVSLQPTADAVGNSFIAENKDEYQETVVTISDTTMDITKFRPGETVGLRGFGSFIDRLNLKIVRVEYGGNQVNLTLGNLPLRFTDQYENLLRGLIAEQTVANPSAPS